MRGWRRKERKDREHSRVREEQEGDIRGRAVELSGSHSHGPLLWKRESERKAEKTREEEEESKGGRAGEEKGPVCAPTRKLTPGSSSNDHHS